MKATFLLPGMCLLHLLGKAQCNVSAEVQPNGTVQKVTASETFYYTKQNTFYSAARYDGVHYFFELIIKPMSIKKLKNKKITIHLSNGHNGELDFYDRYENKSDTSMNVLFEIDKDMLQLLTHYDILSISYLSEEGPKTFKLVLHHDLLRRQLNCLLADNKKE